MSENDEVVDGEIEEKPVDRSKGGAGTHLSRQKKGSDPFDDPVNRRIWDLRIRARRPVTEVAEALGIKNWAVHDRMAKMMRAVPGLEADEVRDAKIEQLQVLDENEAALWATFVRRSAENDDMAMVRLTGAMQKIREQRARMLGFNAPKRIEIEGVVRDPLAVELEEVSRAMDSLDELEALEAAENEEDE